MARKTYVYRPRWAEAVNYFSSDDELSRLAKKKQTLADWKRFGVPADVVLPKAIAYYEARLARRLPQFPEEAIAMAGNGKARAIVLEVFRNLCEIQALDQDLFKYLRNTIEDHAARARSAARRRRSGGG